MVQMLVHFLQLFKMAEVNNLEFQTNKEETNLLIQSSVQLHWGGVLG